LLPFFLISNPSGHDFEFHVNSWMEVVGQWKQGIIFPKWAALAHYGYGEARFVFYPPISWMLGAALGRVLPWRAVPGAYVAISLALSGCSMFFLARRWLTSRDAVFAASLYAINPYQILVVYWRSALAESLAAALLPMLLLLTLRLSEPGTGGAASARERNARVLALALVVSAAWLTNIPAAVMLTYSLALLVAVVALVRRSAVGLGWAAVAFGLGLGLAAFYLVPVAYEQKWVSLAQVLSPGVRPQDNFIFTLSQDADHNRFNLMTSSLAVGEMVVVAGAAILARGRAKREIWWILVAWAGWAASLMLALSGWAWRNLPELRFVQLPWRWLLCLNLSLALLVAFAWRRWIPRLLLCAAMLVALLLVTHHIQPPWWDTADDIAELLDNQKTLKGYEGTDEYVPANADPSETKLDAPLVALEDGSPAPAQVRDWSAISKSFTVSLAAPAKIVLRLLNYPSWAVEVNGRAVGTEAQEVTGQMIVALEAGQSDVTVKFRRTKDISVGAAISAATALVMLALLLWPFRAVGME
jgi:hypothetical protein